MCSLLDRQLTSDAPYRFGLVNAWGVRVLQTLPPADVMTNRRNRYSNLTTNESSYQRPQPRRCEWAVLHLGFPDFDLIPEFQRMDRFYPGTTNPTYLMSLSSRTYSTLWFFFLVSLRTGFAILATSNIPCLSPGRRRRILFCKSHLTPSSKSVSF